MSLVFFLVPMFVAVNAPQRAGATAAGRTRALSYYSQLGDQVLSQSTLVVKARVESTRAIPGGELVTLEVQRLFKGEAPAPLTVLSHPREFFVGSEQVMFLKRYRDGPRYTCVNRFGRDAEFDAKVSCLSRHLSVEKLKTDAERRREVRRLLLDHAAAGDSWTRMNVVHEVRYLRRRYPDLLGAGDQDALLVIARSSPDEDFRQSLQELLTAKVGNANDERKVDR